MLKKPSYQVHVLRKLFNFFQFSKLYHGIIYQVNNIQCNYITSLGLAFLNIHKQDEERKQQTK